MQIQDTARWGRVPAWWLRHPDINADRFCVLSALATYADEAGECEPSQATLARWLQRSRPWVNKIVAELVECGLLEKSTRSRSNGGMTSCRYRLRFLHDEMAPNHDRACLPGDGGSHPDDRNQPFDKQNQTARSAPAREHSVEIADKEVSEVPSADWQPSEEVTARAIDLRPDADLAGHTARFVARCRSKGYRYPPSMTGDAWLSWLIEDTEKSGKPRKHLDNELGQNRKSSTTQRDSRFERYSAWSVAASIPAQTSPRGNSHAR